MFPNLRLWLLSGMVSLLTACGLGDNAPKVQLDAPPTLAGLLHIGSNAKGEPESLGKNAFVGTGDNPAIDSAQKNILAPGILHPCPGFAETGKPPLVYGAECGELSVLENPANPQGEQIKLAILRLPAISATPAADPLFFIQGGPGGSSIAMAEMIYGAFTDVRRSRDLIFVDQRGTGKSNPLECGQLSAAEQDLPEAQQSEKYTILLQQCAAKFRHQVEFYTTPYAINDLHEVRVRLGYSAINLWGGSYGSRVALAYAREYPTETRTIILDGVAPVQIALPKYFAEDAGAALAAVNKECQAQADCSKLYGDIEKKAAQVVARLAKNDAEANTLKILYEHPKHQQPDKVLLSAKYFSELIFMALYSRDLTVLLPRAIADAQREDYRLLASISALAAEQANLTGISEGMRYSIICNEDGHFISGQEVAEAKPFLGLNMIKDIADVCSFWPKVVLPEQYFAAFTSQVPALLLSGQHDPVTPARWAQWAQQYLPKALHLHAPGGNHVVSLEGCMPKLIGQFIAEGNADKLDAQCVSKILPLPTVLGANTKPTHTDLAHP